MTDSYRVRDDCRLCGGAMEKALELPPTPPANEFVDAAFVESGAAQETFPLFLASCVRCGHVQLPVVVPPERLFRNYVYVSGTSPVFVQHFRDYAGDCCSQLGLAPGDLVVEVGSNDGTLLRAFKDLGMRVLGVDPAVRIAMAATDSGVPTMPDFFTPALALRLAETHGKARLVCANNVFAHADDLASIAAGVRDLLAPDGAFVFEVSYLPDVVRGNLFDTIYHEHLSYHHLGPLFEFFRRLGLEVFDARRVPTHGGSVRVYVGFPGRALSKGCMGLMLEEAEAGYSTPVGAHGPCAPLAELAAKIDSLSLGLSELLAGVRASGGTVAGFGAPAKVTTLMHRFGLGRTDVDFIVDDAPLKQGLFTPGKFVPVLPTSALYERRPTHCIVLAWNFAGPIMRNHARFLTEVGGRFVVPIPKLEIYS